MTAVPNVDDYLDDIDQPARDNATITDAGHANYALRKYAQAVRAADDIDRQWQPHIDAIEACLRDTIERRDAAKAPHLSDAEFRHGQLTEYARQVRADNPSHKTVALPAGNVRTRSKPAAVQIADVDALVEWAAGHPVQHVVVKWTPKVLVSDVRKFAEVKGGKPIDPDTGEVVPGLSVRDETVDVTVEVGA